MPVSGPAAPGAIRASAACAAASARSRVDRDERVQRRVERRDAVETPRELDGGSARSACDSWRWSRRSARSADHVAAMRARRIAGPSGPRGLLFDHLRHKVEPVLDGRREALEQLVLVGLGDTTSSRSGSIRSCACAIGTTPVVSTASSSLIIAKIASSFTRTSSACRGVDLDAGQMGDALDVVDGDRHGSRRGRGIGPGAGRSGARRARRAPASVRVPDFRAKSVQ